MGERELTGAKRRQRAGFKNPGTSEAGEGACGSHGDASRTAQERQEPGGGFGF
jgi:hypothetical protein